MGSRTFFRLTRHQNVSFRFNRQNTWPFRAEVTFFSIRTSNIPKLFSTQKQREIFHVPTSDGNDEFLMNQKELPTREFVARGCKRYVLQEFPRVVFLKLIEILCN